MMVMLSLADIVCRWKMKADRKITAVPYSNGYCLVLLCRCKNLCLVFPSVTLRTESIKCSFHLFNVHSEPVFRHRISLLQNFNFTLSRDVQVKLCRVQDRLHLPHLRNSSHESVLSSSAHLP